MGGDGKCSDVTFVSILLFESGISIHIKLGKVNGQGFFPDYVRSILIVSFFFLFILSSDCV